MTSTLRLRRCCSHELNELCRLMGLPSRPQKYDLFFEEHVTKCDGADWTAVSRRLDTHPEEASAGIRYRTSIDEMLYPLGIALSNRRVPVPTSVVKKILRIRPNSLEIGHSALNVALDNDEISIEIWRVLLSHAAPRNQIPRGFLLDVLNVARRSLKHSKSSLELIRAIIEIENKPDPLKNAEGRSTPLALILARDDPSWQAEPSIELVILLLEGGLKHSIDAGGLLIGSNWNYDKPMNAYGRACGLYPALRVAIERVAARDEAMRTPDDSYCRILLLCLRVAAAAAAGVGGMGETFPALHGALRYAPLGVVKDLIQRSFFGPDSHIAVDPMGRTALHAALQVVGDCLRGHLPNILKDIGEWREFLQEFLLKGGGAAANIKDQSGALALHVASEVGLAARDGLDLIVSANPNAAACCDAEGRLPIHLAIKSGRLGHGSGLACIIDACPRAVTCRDPSTGMNPFMLAGCAESSDIDAVYMLLRADPMAVQGGIKQTAKELYLLKKLKDCEEMVAILKSENSALKRKVEEMGGSSNSSGDAKRGRV